MSPFICRYANWDRRDHLKKMEKALRDEYLASKVDKNVKNPGANDDKIHYGGPKFKLNWPKGQVKNNGERYVNKDLFYFPQEGDR